MPRSPFARFADLFDPKRMVTFLFGAISLAVLGNATHDLLKNQIGESRDDLVKIALGALLILIATAVLLTIWGRRPGAILPNPGKAKPKPRRGLIFLIGRREPLLEALAAHTAVLERVWLVCSPQSAKQAHELAVDSEVTSNRRIVEVVMVDDANDPVSFFWAVRRVYDHLPVGWDKGDVIADYVGMTAHASVGMVLACLQVGAPLEYTPAEHDANLRAIRPLPPFEVVLDTAPPVQGSGVAQSQNT